ncbi:class I SAM-dependent methyltransferase [Mucilaginibacter psychrotolerans]|uniref:Class I SAM-dependent methyltransferase n=1 Tax=Mucilaginibacter psychrotolerans TaxID=1524096 RepID=A0A4Y8S637_9SPHI|nr:class I SAM-dependent methyltransferase [Mucilaginibacter psychrotolerans]TFF33927.1 class I SAM-dependent methyltransferase [Mucilaginibacter psychrotolerans]
MTGNYDNSASFYDGLSRLVFGDALVKAQVYLLPNIPAGSKILLIGGGTGWILEEISKIHPSGLYITYVEISAKMMALSQKRITGANHVEFINKAIEDVDLMQDFDVVITPFLFDNYKPDTLPATCYHIHQMLKPGGMWLNTDFQLTGKWWQHVILKSMLLFFKVLCGVESWRLPDVQGEFNKCGYTVMETKLFFGDFVVTRMYKRNFF